MKILILNLIIFLSLFGPVFANHLIEQLQSLKATSQTLASINRSLVPELEEIEPVRFFDNLMKGIGDIRKNLNDEKMSLLKKHLRQLNRRVIHSRLHEMEGTMQPNVILKKGIFEMVRALNAECYYEERGYAAKFVKAAKGAPGEAQEIDGKMHVYGTRTWTSATGKTVTIGGIKRFYPGWNSCARVVSAILKHAGWRTSIYNRVRSVESNLKSRGFRKVSYDDTKPGDIVVWAKEGGLNHIGIYTGWGINMEGPGWTTVDNWSISGEPEHRPLNRETLWGWKIRVILRPTS